MQILLTEQEYNDLKNAKIQAEKNVQDIIQDLCTKVADHMIIDVTWGEPRRRSWKCILSHHDRCYCDQCPVQKVCPSQHKQYSQ